MRIMRWKKKISIEASIFVIDVSFVSPQFWQPYTVSYGVKLMNQ